MEEFAQEFVKPFEICFDLLGRSHIYVLKPKIYLFERVRSSFFKVCAGTFYVGTLTYIFKAFSGQNDLFNLAVVVPVLGVASQLFYWMNILGSWQYILGPLFETLFRKYVLQEKTELLLPFICDFSFDQTKTWTRYIAVYIFMSYSMIHLVYIYLGTEFLLVTLCAHLSIEFSMLQEDLRQVKPFSVRNDTCDADMENCSTVKKYNDRKVRDIIQNHQRLTTKLDEIFNKIIFFNLLSATIIICFFGFVATKARGPADMANNFVGVVASMFHIFNLCYCGELLSRASAGIANAAFESSWYNGDKYYKRNIIIIIMRSQRPCRLTSLKYVPVSLNTFTTVMSTTWSYFSLATTMYEENNN